MDRIKRGNRWYEVVEAVVCPGCTGLHPDVESAESCCQ